MSQRIAEHRPDLPNFRIPIHGHTHPRNGGVIDAGAIGGGGGAGGSSGSGGGLASISDGTTTVTPVTSATVPPGGVTDLTGGDARLNFLTDTNGGGGPVKPHGSMGATETFDPADGNVHTGTLDADCTFTLTAPTGTGACTLELRLTQDGTGGWDITWPGSVTLVGTLDSTASTESLVIVESLDGGSTWVAVVVGSGGATYATPAIVLGTAAAAGAATTTIRSDSTIVAFDATVPTTAAFGDSAATGSAAVAARRDHKHGMPATAAITEAQVYGVGGHWEVLMDPATSSPPVPLTTPDGTDWVYGWLSDGG